jgi:hypothetical protein
MTVETPLAYQFILQDDIYLSGKDKQHLKQQPAQVTVAAMVETPKAVFKYLGKNKKKFLIVVNYPGLEHMDTVHLAGLESTLKRLGHEQDDIALLNLASHEHTLFDEFAAFFGPEKLLILGKKALPKGFAPPPFNQPGKSGSLRVLFTFGFDEMMNSNENKKAFWEQMKQF